MTDAEKTTVATEPPPEPAPAVEDPPAIPKEVEILAPPTEPAAQPPLSDASTNPAALQWKDKASVFLTASTTTFAAAATKASTAVAGAADAGGKTVRTGWENTKEGWQRSVQPRVSQTIQSTKETWATHVLPKVEASVETALKVAADTGNTIRKNTTTITQRVAEVTKTSLERSRSFLIRCEILPPEAGTPVFGASLESVVKAQTLPSPPVPHLVLLCAAHIEEEGLLTHYLFKDDGDREAIAKLITTFDRDTDRTTLPPSTTSQDAAQLLLAYFRCLPEPLLTYALHEAVVGAGGDPVRLQALVRGLPLVNRATLDCLMQLLAAVAGAEETTKMDAQKLAVEWAPVLLWQKETAPSTVVGGTVGGEGAAEGRGGEGSTEEGQLASDGAGAESEAEKAQKAILAATVCFIEQHGIIFGEKVLEETPPTEIEEDK